MPWPIGKGQRRRPLLQIRCGCRPEPHCRLLRRPERTSLPVLQHISSWLSCLFKGNSNGKATIRLFIGGGESKRCEEMLRFRKSVTRPWPVQVLLGGDRGVLLLVPLDSAA